MFTYAQLLQRVLKVSDTVEPEYDNKRKHEKNYRKPPEDASYEEIIRELALAEMIERGLKDLHEGHVVSNEEMGKRIRLWQK
jgi:predicted transcriptional regulator